MSGMTEEPWIAESFRRTDETVRLTAEIARLAALLKECNGAIDGYQVQFTADKEQIAALTEANARLRAALEEIAGCIQPHCKECEETAREALIHEQLAGKTDG